MPDHRAVGEDRTGGPQTHQRLTVAQAADLLGITEGAVRSRIKRGTLRTTKEGGRLYVLWGGRTAQANQTPNTGAPTDHTAELIATLRDQLAAERQAHAEARRIIAGLVERVPPAIEAPRETPGASESATVEADSSQQPRPATGGAQEPSERRGFWARLFGTPEK